MKPRTLIRRTIAEIGRNRFLFVLSLLFSLCSVIFALSIPVLAGQAIDAIRENGTVDFAGLKTPLIRIVICAVCGGILQWGIGVLNNRIAYHTVKNIRNKAFIRLQQLPISYLDSHAYGDIVSRMISDAEQLSDGLILGFSQLFTGLITIVITLLFMVGVSPAIAAAVVILTPLSLFTARYIAGHTYDLFRRQSETRGEQTALINEMIGNQKTVQAFSYEEKALERFDESNRRLNKVSLKAVFFSSLTNPTTRFINNVIYAVVGLMGALFALSNHITVGMFVSFLAYSTQYTKPFNEISSVITELQNAFACAARLFELIDEPAQSSDRDLPELPPAQGEIAFRGVTFSYDKTHRLIENFAFHTSPGKKIAIVGPTGCGKTTLINLLMRFYDPDAGEITVDGTPITGVTRQSLRGQIGMVLQETWILHGTVRENIAFGNPNATESEIIEAAKAAWAHEFIMRLENGYDTVIGENDSLSEGERQLLCIARVMLRKPPMLILDEATSSIDTRTEQKVQAAFMRLMEGKTSLVVAHRLSTVQDADMILVLKDGRVAEQGTHAQLLAKNGFYTALYKSQFAPD